MCACEGCYRHHPNRGCARRVRDVEKLWSVIAWRAGGRACDTPLMPTYEYPRPAVSTDIAVLRGAPGARELLLVRRGEPPFEGMWALPGGFVEEGERLSEAAERELAEETGLTPRRPLVQLGSYGDPGRDPRGWTVTVLFAVLLADDEPDAVSGGDDAAEAAWHPVDALPDLAFDHSLLAHDAIGLVAGLE